MQRSIHRLVVCRRERGPRQRLERLFARAARSCLQPNGHPAITRNLRGVASAVCVLVRGMLREQAHPAPHHGASEAYLY